MFWRRCNKNHNKHISDFPFHYSDILELLRSPDCILCDDSSVSSAVLVCWQSLCLLLSVAAQIIPLPNLILGPESEVESSGRILKLELLFSLPINQSADFHNNFLYLKMSQKEIIIQMFEEKNISTSLLLTSVLSRRRLFGETFFTYLHFLSIQNCVLVCTRSVKVLVYWFLR